MSKHLSLDDRYEIKTGLKNGLNLTEIGERIGKNRTTIGREIKAHRVPQEEPFGNACIYRQECSLPRACSHFRNDCTKHNMNCRTVCHRCKENCDRYEEELCTRYNKPPYVCDGCRDRPRCRLRKMIYDPKTAQTSYEKVLSESRKGISLSENELMFLDEIVSPCIIHGQSIPVVCENHKDELPVSERTVYSYIDSGILTAGNLDLHRKVRMSPRKKSGPTLRVDKSCHIGRTYEDFLSYTSAHPDVPVVEMDSVEGRRGGKVLLTLFFCNCSVQLIFLRDRNTAATVTVWFNWIRDKLGASKFRELFPIILVDRGSEFTDPKKIEIDPDTGELLSRVFYCDPQNSNQKSHCERNHEFIRYIFPKGTSLDALTQEDVRKAMNHINSYPRKKWNGQAPLDLFSQFYGEETTTLLGLKRIPSDSIILTPALLK